MNAVLTGNERCQHFMNTVAAFAPRAKDVCEGRTTPGTLLSEFVAAVAAGQAMLMACQLTRASTWSYGLLSAPNCRRRRYQSLPGGWQPN
eukprot:7964420-Pyramimonas_sp.AAC.1